MSARIMRVERELDGDGKPTARVFVELRWTDATRGWRRRRARVLDDGSFARWLS